MTRGDPKTRVFKGKYALVGASSISSCRIYVRPHVQLPFGDLDDEDRLIPLSRMLKRSPRFKPSPAPPSSQTIGNRHERPRQGGLSLSAALCVVGLFVFVFGIMTLVQTSRMTEKAKINSMLKAQIEEGLKANDALAVDLSKASDSAKICYAAARNLGMVSAEGADVVYLVASDTRPQNPSAQATVPPVRSGIYATLFGFLE